MKQYKPSTPSFSTSDEWSRCFKVNFRTFKGG